MKYLNKSELDTFVANNAIMFGSREKPGLMLTPAGEVVKCVYPRRRFSKTTLMPAVQAFANNGKKLRERGIAAPDVSEVSCCKDVPVFMVSYPKLHGEDLRQLCEQGDISILAEFARYLAYLHKLGIYFRALHLGNILKMDSGGLGLIDIADLKTQNSALHVFVRGRNIARLLNVDEDKDFFSRFGVQRFLDTYFEAANLGDLQKRIVMFRMNIRLDADVKKNLTDDHK